MALPIVVIAVICVVAYLALIFLALLALGLGGLYHEFVCGEFSRNKIRNTKDAWGVIAERMPKQIRRVENRCKINITLWDRLGYLGLFYNWFPVKEIRLEARVRPWVVLHEYGHFIDWSLRRSSKLSNLEEWQNIFREARFAKSLIFYNKILLNLGSHRLKPNEFFAECFMLFYLSSRSKGRLKKLFPEAYRYFQNLESQALQFMQPSLFER